MNVYGYDISPTQIQGLKFLDGGPTPYRGIDWHGLLVHDLVYVDLHVPIGQSHIKLTSEGIRVLAAIRRYEAAHKSER